MHHKALKPFEASEMRNVSDTHLSGLGENLVAQLSN